MQEDSTASKFLACLKLKKMVYTGQKTVEHSWVFIGKIFQSVSNELSQVTVWDEILEYNFHYPLLWMSRRVQESNHPHIWEYLFHVLCIYQSVYKCNAEHFAVLLYSL